MKLKIALLTLALISSSCFADMRKGDSLVEKGLYGLAYQEFMKVGKSGNVVGFAKAGDLVMNDVIEGVKPEEAVKLFSYAAEKGDADSMMRMAFFYKTGFLGVKESPIKERDYLKQATASGHKEAQSALGWLQLTSNHPAVSDAPAGKKNLLESIQKGSPYGYVRLGQAYWLGVEGFKRNQIVGYALYKSGQSRGIRGEEPKIEQKAKDLMRDKKAAEDIAKLREELKRGKVEAVLSSYFKSNPEFYDYRSASPDMLSQSR